MFNLSFEFAKVITKKPFFNSLFGVGPLWSLRPRLSIRKVAHLAWVTAVQLLIIRKFLLSDAFLADAHFKDLRNKPFLKLLLDIDGHWNYAITYLLTLLYYIFTLPRIINGLERFTTLSSSPSSSPSSFLTTLITFLIAITLMTTFFLVSYMAILFEYLKEFSLWEVLLSMALLYVNYLVFTLPLVLAHFIQSTTYQVVAGVVEGRHQLTIDQLKEQFGQAAKANRALHRLNSPPMAAFVVSNTISSLSCICRFSDRPEVNFTTWFLGMLLVQLHLARLTARTTDKFEELLTEVAKFSCGSRRTSLKSTNSKTKFLAFQEQNSCMRSMYGTYRELCLYRDDFSLSIFDILVIDYSFVFSLVLFLLNYCVFMLQTSNI